MVFSIDFSKYKLIDLSQCVVPNRPDAGDRPFVMEEGRLGDRTYKFDIVKTHTHVGTHIESPWHFFHEGKSITDFPLHHFMGTARLLKAAPSRDSDRVRLSDVQHQLEPYRGSFEMLLIRNDSGSVPLHFDMETVPYIRDLNIKMLVFQAGIEFGYGIEDGRSFHDILMSKDICLVEFPENCSALDRDEFYLFAVPNHIKGLDSAMCRLFAVVEY